MLVPVNSNVISTNEEKNADHKEAFSRYIAEDYASHQPISVGANRYRDYSLPSIKR